MELLIGLAFSNHVALRINSLCHASAKERRDHHNCRQNSARAQNVGDADLIHSEARPDSIHWRFDQGKSKTLGKDDQDLRSEPYHVSGEEMRNVRWSLIEKVFGVKKAYDCRRKLIRSRQSKMSILSS
jgi:hypothetical protein